MPRHTLTYLPVILALLALGGAGLFLLHRADTQARDTIRKHHLQDIEDALYLAYAQHGTYPPYTASSWCGVLQDEENTVVREEVERALRLQNEKYANPAKPFPTDPEAGGYFYWKRSPAVFELYSHLETTPTGDRTTARCPGVIAEAYDYGINSRLR